jgi:hypothetical protein
MSAEKHLQSVREKIGALLPLLEEFMQENYQPLSSETHELKRLLNELSEDLLIYLHYISKKEISSSFQIHQAVSKVASDEKKESSTEEIDSPHKMPDIQIKDTQTDIMDNSSIEPPKVVPITLSINDRYLILRQLFKNSQLEWDSAFQQFSMCQTKTEILDYLNSLRKLYGWDVNDNAYQILEKACLKKFA